MNINRSITMEIVELVEVSKHVSWCIFNHHVLRASRVLWLLECRGVARSRRNVLQTTISIGAVRMKVEVGFKPFPLRCFASLGLLVQNDQMLWGLALVSGVRVASTLVAKLSFIKLELRVPFPRSEFLGFLFLLRFRLPLKFEGLLLKAPSNFLPFATFIWTSGRGWEPTGRWEPFVASSSSCFSAWSKTWIRSE